MIEKVAINIYDNELEGGRSCSWDDLFSSEKTQYMRQAKAAIEAMREPTEGMKIAGTLDAGCGGPDEEYIGQVWQAMIDAALKEE